MTMGISRRIAAAAATSATSLGVGYSLYLTAIGAAAIPSLRERARREANGTNQTRFRILIPAYDEEVLIKDTIAAALAIDYPADRFEVHVVADNCSDRTAEIAEAAGAQVHVRVAPDNPGKGPALHWLIERLDTHNLNGDPNDVVVIVDADTLVGPNLLQAFSSYFEDGAVAVQGHYAVRDEEVGGEVGLRSAAFAVRHLVRPAGRVHLGGSSSLYGNGMAFTEEIARTFPWSSHLTEDLEMGLRLLLAGHTVEFAPGAIVRGEMPDSLEAASSQHERWESGRRAVARTYVPTLVSAAWRSHHGRRWRYVDSALDIAMPPFGTLIAVTGSGVAGLVIAGRGTSRIVGAGAGISSIGLLAAHVLGSLRIAGAPTAVYSSLLRAPINIAWKAGILLRTLRKGPTDWVRTSRNDTSRTDTSRNDTYPGGAAINNPQGGAAR